MSMPSEQLASLLAQPALDPPEGITPDFNNPPNRNGLAWFVTTFCTVVTALCCLIRGYTKIWVTRALKIEEALMILGLIAYCVTNYAGYSMIYTPGYYVHQWNLRYEDMIRPLYLILVYGCSYSATLPLIKSAILLDWCRIFVPAEKTKSFFWWGCMFVVFLQSSWGIACITLLNLQCTPHNAIWDFYLQTPDNCYSLPKVMLTSASVQVVSDWTMVLLPQKVIWSLNMNWQRKVGISVLFTIGVLASISASVRLHTTINFAGTDDQMYFIAPLLFWACAEMTCGFFILSVPCIPSFMSESGASPRLKRLLQHVPGRSGKSTGDSNSQSYRFGDIVTIGGSNGNKKGPRENTYFEIADSSVELGVVDTHGSRDDKARHKSNP